MKGRLLQHFADVSHPWRSQIGTGTTMGNCPSFGSLAMFTLSAFWAWEFWNDLNVVLLFFYCIFSVDGPAITGQRHFQCRRPLYQITCNGRGVAYPSKYSAFLFFVVSNRSTQFHSTQWQFKFTESDIYNYINIFSIFLIYIYTYVSFEIV